MKRTLLTIIAICSATLAGVAQSTDSTRVVVHPGGLQMPLVFNGGRSLSTPDSVDVSKPKSDDDAMKKSREWLDKELARRRHVNETRDRTIVNHPDAVPYNVQTLPEPPKEHVVKADPKKNHLDIETKEELPLEMDGALIVQQEKRHNWLHTLKGGVHFTQSFISGNWYQGGENNENVLADFQWDVNLNQKLHPNFLFDNTIRYKVGVVSTHSDTLRSYAVNDDYFSLSSKFGYRAIKNWYYSASLLFKTQLFHTYKSNTNTMKSSLLSPAELNLGLGMTYTYKDKENIKTLSLSVAPFSYNMKYCRDITNLSPTSFGIEAGKHFKHNFGSNLEAKWTWSFSPQISWSSRFYVFTNYEYVQGDWENTLDCSVTRHLTSRIFVHLRYDKSRPYDEDWKYWQAKEILSFGLTYRFSTN